MKRTLSLALIVGVVVSVLPAFAAEQADPAPGPIARAVQREAVRLARSDVASSAADPRGQDSRRSLADWSRVLNLKRGAEITLIRSGLSADRRHMLRADENGLTVLNVVIAPALPAATRKMLIRTASEHPDYFLRAQQGEDVSLSAPHLRLTAEGVVDGDRKIANLDRIVESIPRTDVAEIRTMSKHVGRHVKRGLLIGVIAGGAFGVLAGAGCASSDCGDAAGWMAAGAVVGAGYGTMIGTVVGVIAPRSPNVIYRAP